MHGANAEATADRGDASPTCARRAPLLSQLPRLPARTRRMGGVRAPLPLSLLSRRMGSACTPLIRRSLPLISSHGRRVCAALSLYCLLISSYGRRVYAALSFSLCGTLVACTQCALYGTLVACTQCVCAALNTLVACAARVRRSRSLLSTHTHLAVRAARVRRTLSLYSTLAACAVRVRRPPSLVRCPPSLSFNSKLSKRPSILWSSVTPRYTFCPVRAASACAGVCARL